MQSAERSFILALFAALRELLRLGCGSAAPAGGLVVNFVFSFWVATSPRGEETATTARLPGAMAKRHQPRWRLDIPLVPVILPLRLYIATHIS